MKKDYKKGTTYRWLLKPASNLFVLMYCPFLSFSISFPSFNIWGFRIAWPIHVVEFPTSCATLSEQECKTQWSDEKNPEFTDVGPYFHSNNALLSPGLPTPDPSLHLWYFILFCHTRPNSLLQFPRARACALVLQLSVLLRSASLLRIRFRNFCRHCGTTQSC